MAKKKILIVEDHPDNRELLVLVLKQSGYDVVEARTGLAAIERARAVRPDLILMDLGLPGITGDEAIARLRKDPATQAIPVIAYTAYQKGSRLAKRALDCGAAEILYLPFDLAALIKTLQRYLLSD